MRRILGSLICSMLAVILIACADSGPSKDYVQAEVAESLPTYLTITDFDLEASENVGTNVEPLYRGRFRANVAFRVETFSEASAEPGIVFLRLVRSEGEKTQIFGKIQSRLHAGSWKSSVAFEGVDLNAFGEPRTAFNAQRTIVLGTDEENEYRKEQKLAIEETARRMAGVWTGEMNQLGASPFPITIKLLPFSAGESCGTLEHPSLECSGTFRCVELRENLYVVEQLITFGRDRCLGGKNHLRLQPDGTLLRTWFYPQSNREGARGVLIR